MTREAKVGILMVAVLVGVFGFLVYKRVYRPSDLLAKQQVANAENAGTGGGEQEVDLTEFDLKHQLKDGIESLQVVRKAKKADFDEALAAAEVEEQTEPAVEDVAEEVQPPVQSGQERLENPLLPPDLSTVDQTIVRAADSRSANQQSVAIPLPEASDNVFDDAPEQVPSTGANQAARKMSSSEPFELESASPQDAPIEFEKPEVRETDSGAVADDQAEEKQTREVQFERTARETVETEVEPELPQRAIDRPQFAPRGRRPAASLSLSIDDAPGELKSSKPIPVGGVHYTVQPNDNFWSISRKRYGAGRFYMALAMHNRKTVPDPKMMKPGVVIATPDVSVLEQLYGDSIPKSVAIESSNPVKTTQSRRPVESEPAGYFVAPNGEPMYRVGQNDTLTDIAKSHLRRSSRWVQILEMNRNVLRDGNELKVGTVLRLPADASRVRIAER